MKHFYIINALALMSPLALALYLARARLLDPEVLAAYWIEPFLFGTVIGVGAATVVFAICFPNQSSSGGQS
jgi:hypothetical protein